MLHSNTFGGRLAALRACVPDLSQRAVDELAGLHPSHVWNIERLLRENPTLNTVRPLARVFGVTVGWLAGGELPCIAAAPELDPSQPEHAEAITAHVRAAVEFARRAPAGLEPVEVLHAADASRVEGAA